MAKVAVLGCGPAGLLAAHAAQILGHEPTIFSPKVERSHITGAQYLHSAIPGITSPEPDDTITYEHYGTREGYAKKIYGESGIVTSWDRYPDRVPVPAWSLRGAYDTLWRCYRHNIHELHVDPAKLKEISEHFFLVLSTAPRKHVQAGNASFESVWIKQYSQSELATFRTQPLPTQTIQYSGDERISWYRCSDIFGSVSCEWPNKIDLVPPGAVRVHKPLGFTASEQAPANVRFLGRYGQWKKGVLVDQVFATASGMLS